MKPQIIVDDYKGFHNSGDAKKRLEVEGLYKDRSTVCIIPTRGVIPARVVQNWLGMMTPMNQKFMRIFAIGLEVGEAYQQTVESVLENPELRTWQYILTLEEDNMVPPDGLLKLYNAMDEGYDVVGGLYWTKGEGGQPMCYGNPNTFPINFVPQIPQDNVVTRCNGLGMGFTLFKMSVFTEGRLDKPWFKTVQGYDPAKGGEAFTQDLYFFNKACKLGYKIGCDSRVRVGHFDINSGVVW